MNRKIIAILFCIMVTICLSPSEEALALSPPVDCAIKYKVPKDFIWWMYGKKHAGPTQDEFIKAYREEQGYLLAPQITDAVLDDVCWGYDTAAVNYAFHKGNVSWRMYVLPAKNCKEEYGGYTLEYYSDDIVDLVSKKEGEIVLDKKKSDKYIDKENYRNSYYFTEYYLKKKLQLGDRTIVDCVQNNLHIKYLYQNRENVYVTLHFIKDGMYVRVTSTVKDGQENVAFDALKTCTFEKLPTNPKLTLEKKKNKVSKKNAILHATLQNPTNQDLTYIKLYLYDKKEKRYRMFLRKKAAKNSMRKEKVSLKFNVLKIIKDRRNRFLRKKKSFFPLKRKKKYKYMIRTKVNGTYLEAKGSFKLL